MDKENIYQRKVDDAKRFFKQKREEDIKRWTALYIGKLFDESIPENDRVFVNYTFSNIENKISSLYYKNPKINIQPRKDNEIDEQGQIVVDYSRNAKSAEQTLNYEMREYAIKKQIRKSLYDWKIAGYGTMFTGWETDVTYAKKTEPGYTGKLVDNSKSFQVLPSVSKEVTDEEAIDEIKKDQPDFRRIRSDKIYFSPDSEDDDDIHNRYVVVEETVAYEDLKNDKRFKKEDIDSISDSSMSYLDGAQDTKSDYGKRCTLYHVWSKDKYCIVVSGLDHPLFETENKYKDIFGDDEPLPFVFIWGTQRLGEFYPYSDVYLTQDQQNELNKIRAEQINHRKRFSRIYLYRKGKVDPLDIEKIENAEDGSLVGITTDDPLSDVVMPLQDANLTFPFQLEPLIKEDINIISGINQYQRGSGMDQIKTLGQTQIAEAHSQSRRDQEQSIVEEFVEKIYRRLLQLNQSYLQKPLAIQITGENNSQEWLEVTSEEIQGEFNLQVESGSTVKLDDDIIRKQALDAYNLFGQSPMLNASPKGHEVLKKIIVSVLDANPSLKGVAEELRNIPTQELLPPPPPPAPKPPNESFSFPVDKMWPMLPPEIQAQILDRFGIKATPDQMMPSMPPDAQGLPPQGADMQSGAIEPSMLGQGADQASINQGVSQLR